jgi:hypothetical protein
MVVDDCMMRDAVAENKQPVSGKKELLVERIKAVLGIQA